MLIYVINKHRTQKPSIMKLLYTLGVIFSMTILSSSVFGQLAAGDIAFIGFNEDEGPLAGQEHSFSWISLTDIPAGEVIYFTEQGVNINSTI